MINYAIIYSMCYGIFNSNLIFLCIGLFLLFIKFVVFGYFPYIREDNNE